MAASLKYSYRFRSTDALLGTRQELRNQEIYFASPAELNDPLEGFRDIFWRADATVWRNFLRHYLLCLMQSILVAAISEHDGAGPSVASFIGLVEEDLGPELRDAFTEISSEFFSDIEIAPLPELLAGRVSPIRRSELLSILWTLHFRAWTLICSRIHAISQLWSSTSFAITKVSKPLRFKESFAAFNRTATERSNGDERLGRLAESMISAISQNNLVLEYNGLSQKHGAPWRRVISDFPDTYVNALERLLFYDAYTASFVCEPHQASMWSTYGDQHRGCC